MTVLWSGWALTVPLCQVPDITRGGQGSPDRGGGEGGGPGGPGGLQDHLGPPQHPGESGEGEADVHSRRHQEGAGLVPEGEHAEGLSAGPQPVQSQGRPGVEESSHCNY